MKAKLLKSLLAIAYLLCSIAVYAHDFEVDGIYYDITSEIDQTVEVTYFGYHSYNYNEYTGTVEIPESATYNGTNYSVTSIGNYAFDNCTGLTEVTIGNSVTSIDDYAFKDCTGLTEVTIPNSVTFIGNSAFEDCTGLTTLNFNAENCTYMGSYWFPVFEGCNNLKTLNISESVKTIPAYAFRNCTGLTEVTIPNSVTSIGEGAFRDCTGLIEITIPNSVTSIGERAFEDCTGLIEVTIPNSVTSIGDYAFKGCTGLKSLTIKDGDATLKMGYNYYSSSSKGEGLFYDCPIETLYIGRNLSYSTDDNYGYSPFYYIEELKTVTIGNSVTSIGYAAFRGCTGLKSLTIEDGDATLELGYNGSYEGLFDDCPIEILYIGRNLSYITGYDYGFSPFARINELKTVTIGNSVTSIGDWAFYGCTGLTAVSIPNSVTSIGERAFYECTGLTEVTIGNSVTSIGDYAFYECTGLREVTIGNSVTSIGEYAFYRCTGLTEVIIPNSVTSIGNSAFDCCPRLTEVTIPNSVTSIGNSAFDGCTGLKEVTIGNSVTSIGDYAFYECTGLREVTIGNSVTSIGDYAFYECTGLREIHCHATTPPTINSSTFSYYTATLYVLIQSVSVYEAADYWKYFAIEINPPYFVDGLYYNILSATDVGVTYKDDSYNSYSGVINIPETIEIGGATYNVTSIGEYAFYRCTGLTEVTIPNSVTSIGESAFAYCSGLTEVTIPNSVTSIGDWAFYGCTGLTEIAIPNSVTSIGYAAFRGCTGLTTVNFNAENCTTMGSSEYMVFEGCSNLTAVNIGESVKIIPAYAFSGRTGLKEVTIGNSVTSIGHDAFKYCTELTGVYITDLSAWCGIDFGSYHANPLYYAHNLYINNELVTSLVIPDDITSVGDYAFYGCTRLTEITIPNSVTSIGESAFYDCTGLTKAIIGNGVTSIGNSAFGGCASLDSIYIGRKVATVGENAFSDCKKLADITIPASVTTIDDYVFSGCTSLSDVVIEDRTTALSLGSNGSSGLFADCPLDSVYIGGKITYKTSSSYGYSPFYRNTSLRTVVITDTETEIYDNEFYGCSNLTKVTIGDGVKKIGNWAFSGCSSLDHFAFGTNVESIGQEAFSDCTNVTNIRSYSAVPPVCGTQALDDINKWNCTLSVLENCQSAYQTAEQWKDFFFVNAMDKDGKVVAPVITVDSVVVTISCETAKTTIYYTTDGSEPTVESALYTGPFVVDKNCTIKAIAVRTNYYNSDVSTAQVDYFVYAESIAIDYETVSIRLNESVTLTATVLPETTTEKGVVWSSSDENIATVENGIVTAHTIGEATITATTTDGTNLSATCKVTVLPILADTITLDQTNITAIAGETVVLTATIYPEDATEKAVVWSVSDATIATIEPIDNLSAKITVLKEGVATITATTIDGSNLSATCTIDVYSGIKNVQLDDTPTEYYDLSGRRVEHPTQGVYITKQGSTVRKVVVNER